MKKLILIAAALLIAGQASAYAQGDHASRHHKRLMSSHAQMRGYGGGNFYGAPAYGAPEYAPYSAPDYGYGGGYGGQMDDPSAEGRTGS
jgi:hypothetical protein